MTFVEGGAEGVAVLGLGEKEGQFGVREEEEEEEEKRGRRRERTATVKSSGSQQAAVYLMCENSVGPPAGGRIPKSGRQESVLAVKDQGSDVLTPAMRFAFLTAVGTAYSAMKVPASVKRK